jgi:hypothetical protein
MLDSIANGLAELAPHVYCHPRTRTSTVGKFACNIKGALVSGEYGDDAALLKAGYLSAWYITPRQHIIETICSVIVLAPVLLYVLQKCSERVSLHTRNKSFDLKPVPVWQKLWAVVLLVSIAAQLWFKWNCTHVSSHPAYLAQPCHIHR